MIRDFNLIIKNFDGRPNFRTVMKYDENGLPATQDGKHLFSHYEPMTLRTYALDAISQRTSEDAAMTVAQAQQRAKLHDKLTFSTDGKVDITLEEGKMILDCLLAVGRDPIVVARMKDLFETDPVSATVSAISKV